MATIATDVWRTDDPVPGVSEAAWELTKALSPRTTVRVSAVDSAGHAVNDYPHFAPVTGDVPATPWAMYLTDDDGTYRYLCFDLDASKGNAAWDTERLSMWLHEFNIAHTVCISGSRGGRHIWVALAEPIPHSLVAALGKLVAQLIDSLDVSPLMNPATGCVRPPGTPHRDGSHSEPMTSIDPIFEPTTTVEQLNRFRDFLLDEGAVLEAPVASLIRGIEYDATGHPYLVGTRRELTARIRHLLNFGSDNEDASLVMSIVLAGCAGARWRYTDIAALLDTSPALEHARTVRGTTGRKPRSDWAAERTLSNGWKYAVDHVSATAKKDGAYDPSFEGRAHTLSTAVDAVLRASTASPGMWANRPARRSVLEAICLYVLQAVRPDVEADTRRLSADTGYGRESCRLALRWLLDNHWLRVTGNAAGVHGATITLGERFSTDEERSEWAQAVTRPADLPPDELRKQLMRLIGKNLTATRHDCFAAPRSLGRKAAVVYRILPDDGGALTSEIVTAAGLPTTSVRRALVRLAESGVAERTETGWARGPDGAREQAAEDLHATGYLHLRSERYAAERQVWAWWNAEVEWMTRKAKSRRRRSGSTAVPLFNTGRPEHARYPRGPDRRGDHRAARHIILAGGPDEPAFEMTA